MLLTLPPLLLAALRTPAASVFSGYVVIARDASVYQAIWRQGWQGAWLFRSPFTSESLPGVLLYPWYLWPAHLLGWIPAPWLYHGERLGAGAALLAALWLLIGELFRPRLLRRWAMVFCALGGGVGIVLPHGLMLGPLLSRATELQSPGSSVADLVAMAPHLPWAMALMCWVLVVGLRLRRPLSLSELISGLVAVVGLQLIYPQLSLLVVGLVGAWALIQGHRRAVWYAIAAALVQAPYLIYLFSVWRTTPAAFSVVRTSLDVGDPFGFLVLSHLVASGLIVIALWRRRLRGDLLLPALWIVGMTLCMFTPGIDRTLGRTFMASSIPFGLCAAPGLLTVLRSIRTAAWRRRAAALILSASSLYGLFSLAQPYWIAGLRLDAAAEYESRAEASLLQRLAPKVSPEDLVLTAYLDGVFVPAQTNARAYVGHPEMTIDAGRKSAQAVAFFGSWSPDQRARFVRANGIDYVLAPDPAAVVRLAGDPELRRVDRQGPMALFKVMP
ncbi:MAG: hypothetical protein E6I56_06500 [Chloroflexi bacterium]|nr:MAG: hypothetical protein E6I56_06500 [Chloroflexota bacterium]